MATPYEREIEEILRNIGPIGPRESGGQRFRRLMALRWKTVWRRVRDLPHTVPADQLMLTALLFVVAAYFMRFVIPGLARFVGLAGVILFVVAFAFSFHQLFGSAHRQSTWRGRPVNMSPIQPTLLDKLFFWLRRRMRGS